jgi:hypothetical protein
LGFCIAHFVLGAGHVLLNESVPESKPVCVACCFYFLFRRIFIQELDHTRNAVINAWVEGFIGGKCPKFF